MRRLSQVHLYLLPGLAVIVFAVSLSWGIQRLNIQQELLHSSEATGGWIATQAELEHVKFLESLQQYVYGDQAGNREAMMLRFEILWSRLDILLNSSDAVHLRKVDGVAETVTGLFKNLQEIEPALESLTPGDLASYRTIRADLEPFGERLRTVTQDALFEGRSSYGHQAIHDAHRLVLGSFIGMLLSGGVLLFILVLQTKKTNTASRESARAQQQLRDAIESISEGFTLYDANDRLVICNARSKGIQAGIEDKLIPGTSFEEIARAAVERGLYGHDVTIEDAYSARLAQHNDPQGPFEQQGGDGRWLLVNEQKTQDGGTVVVRTDVTDLKNVEQNLSAAEEKFRNLVEGSIEGIVIHRDFEILFANEAWANMHGYALDEIRQLESILDVVTPEHRERVTAYKEARKKGEPAPTYYETESLRKDGSRIWVGVMVRLVDWEGESATQLTTIDLTEKKQAENELKAAEEKFRNLVEGSIEGIMIQVDNKALFVNHAWARMHGYSLDEVYELESLEICVAPHERVRVGTYCAARLRGDHAPSSYEYEAVRKDGSTFWLSVLVRLINWNGKLTTKVTAIDISALKAAEERFSKSFHASPDLIAITGPSDGRIYDINETGLKYLGLRHDEAVGKSVLNLDIWIDLNDRNRLMAELQRTKSVRDFETQFRSKNGQIFDVLLSSQWLEIEGQDRVLSIARDITERKRSEAALKASEERFFKAFHASPNMIAIIGRKDGRLYDINENWLAVFRFERDEIVGTTNFDEAYWTDRSRREEFYRLIAAGKVVRNFEIRMFTMGGEIRDYEFAVEGIEIDGEAYAIVVGDDITERKRVERLKSEFVSTVSHELRTPLTSINGSLGLLIGGVAGSLTDESRHLLEIAKSNSDRLIRLINDILDVEKIEAGRMTFELRPVELLPIVKSALSANGPYGERHDVKFVLTEDLPGARVNVDTNRLDQVFGNLLSNAAKFSPKGSVVEIAMSRHNGVIRTAISDQGPGIPPEFQERIFEKFTQVDTSDARGAPGSGLGLSIARAIAEEMNGSIALTSTAGRGCTFYLDLPEWVSADIVSDPIGSAAEGIEAAE